MYTLLDSSSWSCVAVYVVSGLSQKPRCADDASLALLADLYSYVDSVTCAAIFQRSGFYQTTHRKSAGVRAWLCTANEHETIQQIIGFFITANFTSNAHLYVIVARFFCKTFKLERPNIYHSANEQYIFCPRGCFCLLHDRTDCLPRGPCAIVDPSRIFMFLNLQLDANGEPISRRLCPSQYVQWWKQI